MNFNVIYVAFMEPFSKLKSENLENPLNEVVVRLINFHQDLIAPTSRGASSEISNLNFLGIFVFE